MAQLNKVLVIGNLTRDIELRYTPRGVAVADIGMALNRSWKNEVGEEKEEVCFLNVSAFGKQAEAAAKYLKKGSPLFVEGRLHFEEWTAKDGGKRNALKVVAERLQFLGAKRDGVVQDHPKDEPQQHHPVDDDDGIPF